MVIRRPVARRERTRGVVGERVLALVMRPPALGRRVVGSRTGAAVARVGGGALARARGRERAAGGRGRGDGGGGGRGARAVGFARERAFAGVRGSRAGRGGMMAFLFFSRGVLPRGDVSRSTARVVGVGARGGASTAASASRGGTAARSVRTTARRASSPGAASVGGAVARETAGDGSLAPTRSSRPRVASEGSAREVRLGAASARGIERRVGRVEPRARSRGGRRRVSSRARVALCARALSARVARASIVRPSLGTRDAARRMRRPTLVASGRRAKNQ